MASAIYQLQTLPPQGSDEPLAVAVQRTLADAILAGQLPPDTHLEELRLAEHFQVSRTPVREALQQMAATGLVEHRHRRGMFVRDITESQLAEMFEYAAEMEAACAFMATLRMTPGDREALLRVHLESHDCVASKDVDRYDAANLELHERLFHGCHNQYLIDTAMTARARVIPYRRAQFHVADRLRVSYSEHDALIKALLRGQAEQAAMLTRAHVRGSHRTSMQYLHLRDAAPPINQVSEL